MVQEIKFVSLTASHIEELEKIGRATYFDAFAWGNTPENMLNYLDKSFSKQKLLSEINNENSKFYFAKHNAKLSDI